MGTSAISHLKYDLDNYAVALKRVANLAAGFFLEDAIIRMNYLKEIDDYINEMNYRFHQTFDPNERMRIVNDVKAEADMAEREYQLLRLGNYTKYISTEIFEEQGVLKYVKIAGGVVAGGVQISTGLALLEVSKKLHVKKMGAIGVVLAAHGANNMFESLSPVLFEHQSVGPVRWIYRKGAKILGYDKYNGDLIYEGVDFCATLYGAVKMPVEFQNSNRLVPKGWFERPGTGKLFNSWRGDYMSKWTKKNLAMKGFLVGSQFKRFTVEFIEDGYKYEDN